MLAGLTEDMSRRIENGLADLLVKAEAEAVFLCNKGGYILAQTSVEEYGHSDNIAALAAGSFFATREIARLVGEPEFRCVFHQGAKKSLFMQNTPMDLLLVVVFGEQSNPGLVKLCVDEVCAWLDASLGSAGNERSVQEELQRTEMSLNEAAPLFRRAPDPD